MKKPIQRKPAESKEYKSKPASFIKKVNPQIAERQKKHFRAQLKEAVEGIFKEGTYLDKGIERTFKKNKNWRGYEKRVFVESITGMLKNWRLLVALAGLQDKEIFRNFYDLIDIWEWLSNKTKHDDNDRLKERLIRLKKSPAVYYSFPDWQMELFKKEIPHKWEKVLASLNSTAPHTIRLNPIKVSTTEFFEYLDENKIEIEKNESSYYAYDVITYGGIFRTEAFKNGWFELQDAASQEVSVGLEVQPGMRVIDACAGAGGKSLHLATLMQNKGKIIALDTKLYKLQELKRRAARAGASIIEVKEIDSTKVIKRLKETADRVLIDAPCSGTGVYRRNPDAKWRLQPTDIERVLEQQYDILTKYSEMVKVGGKMVYAVCSVLPSEGEKQVERFISENLGWELEKETRFWPDETKCDGFYFARLLKK